MLKENLRNTLKNIEKRLYSLYLWLLWVFSTILGRTPVLLVLIIFILTVLFAYLFSYFEKISLFYAIYWTVITITTVGYGDIIPHTILGKTLAMLVAITGFSTLTVALSIVAHQIVTKAIIEREGGGKVRGTNVLIIGSSSSCVEIAERLRMNAKRIRIVWVTSTDMSEKYLMLARSQGIAIIKGELTQIDTYVRADIKKCSKIIICGKDDKESIAIALVLKSFEFERLYPPTVVAITHTDKGEKILAELIGIDSVVSSKLIGELFMKSFSDPIAAMFLSALSEGHPNLLEVKVYKGPFNLMIAKTASNIVIVGRGTSVRVSKVAHMLSKVRRSKVFVVARVKNIFDIEPLRPNDYVDPNDILVVVEFKSSKM